MASTDQRCCDHDHVGTDELWLTVEELVHLIDDAIDAALALPADATRAERRAAMRARFDADRAARARPKTRAERHDERARRWWS